MYHACYSKVTENGSRASVYQIVTTDFVSPWRPQGPASRSESTLSASFVRAEQREDDGLLDAGAAVQHEQAVDSEALAAHGRSL